MRRTAVILGTLVMAGCSSARISQSLSESDKRSGIESVENIRSLNITNNDFQIQKASVEITSGSGTEKLIASMKFKRPGTYLLSLRSTSGIEAARFFISPDTILVNDRINRKLFHASPGYLQEKYGVSTLYLPVILGDLIGNKINNGRIECRNGEYQIIENTDRETIGFIIDCSKGKVKEVRTGNTDTAQSVMIQFSKFKEVEGLFFAGEINIRNAGEKESIRLTIERISAGTQEEIIFIPGRNYEDVVLK